MFVVGSAMLVFIGIVFLPARKEILENNLF